MTNVGTPIQVMYCLQEFQNGKTGEGRGRIFRSGVCFDAPTHIPYVFVARVVNKIHKVNILY